MNGVPEDVMQVAKEVASTAIRGGVLRDMLAHEIARAILADRKQSNVHWLQWHRKRAEISRWGWLRAAKSALAGDMRDLRNRVEICEAEPIDLVLSEGTDNT